MGSFYSTCAISNISLTQEKTSIQLLVPGYTSSLNGGRGMIVSNDGCQAYFSPFGFPIHGEYSDSGSIDNYVRDKNVEMLEDFFNLEIDALLSCVGDDRWYNYGEKEGNSMWKVKSKDKTNPIQNQKILLSMGMSYYRTEVLEHLQIGWDKHDIVSKHEEYSSEGYLKSIFDCIENTSIMDKKYAELGEEGIERLLGDEDSNLSKDERKVLFNLSDWPEMKKYSLKDTYIASLAKVNMFAVLPISVDDFKDEILKQYTFIRNFGWELNRILLPSVYGSQEDNWTKTYKLNQFVNDLVIKTMEVKVSAEIEYYDKAKKDGDYTEEEIKEELEYYADEIELVKNHNK